MTIQQYIDNVNRLYKTGNAREHSYRGDLQNLIMAILPDVLVTNEPARVACGAPDYVLTKKDIPVGYIEAKDIGVDLGSKTLKEQFDRYKSGLSNLIFTDYMEFHFYKDGVFTTKIAIAKVENDEVKPITENFDQFEELIKNFALTVSQTIKSPSKLAQMMAGKARLMADVIFKSLEVDDKEERKSNLKSQMLSFQHMLIHDIDNKAFADIYAQTIAYGMFAARYHDPTLGDFSRTEAAQLIPKSNPFLRKLFQDIAGFDLDNRLVWIVDELVNIFLASDVADIMKNFGKSTKQEDPVVHFYETFLGEYNPALRKARGVWYTPQPVVNFIVRAVDDVLKSEFGLSQGLADTSKIKVKAKTDVADKRTASGYREYEKEVHKVQILDPATGTGTFLSEVVRHIYKKFKGQQGIWSKYVKQDLIPRLNGFEILMASYAMAHLKMDMLFSETGYVSNDEQRFRIFLTNSLEEAHPDTGTLFSSWLSDEANQANAIKRETPVMVVIGNPPYNGESKNNGSWIMNLMDDYKKEPGGKVKLKERNPKMINDDYVKFIRYGEHFINKTGEGILAFINPHGHFDNQTFRGMRWKLLDSFSKIYLLDLNGNVKKKKVDINGNKDENVFDITTGVTINIFIKKKGDSSNAKVFYHELIGKRKAKYEFLSKNSLSTVKFENIDYKKPDYYLNPKDTKGEKEYLKGFSIDELFIFGLSGLSTKKDDFCIYFDKDKLTNVLDDLKNIDEVEIKEKYKLNKESSSWSLNGAINDVKTNYDDKKIIKVSYRPFDDRYTYYTGNSMGFMGRPKGNLGKHLIKENICLVTLKKSRSNLQWNFVGVSNKMICEPTSITSLDGNYGFPLYVYNDSLGTESKDSNLNVEIINKISECTGLKFSETKENENQFNSLDVFDWVYAVLNSKSYTSKFDSFLKLGFPRVAYPKNAEVFTKLVNLGKELRGLYLFESVLLDDYLTEYPQDGDNIVDSIKYVNEDLREANPHSQYKVGNVFINKTQYFANVPEVAWNFYIGGYQPAQKWLKDRKGRELNFEDILHYQKIIVALVETDRIMKEIDKIDFM